MSAKANGKPSLVSLSLSSIHPAPENELIYRPVSPDDPEIHELAVSIRDHGLQQPLVITKDHYIISGHRRHAACRLLRMEKVLCKIENISRFDPQFETMLVENNRQRVKTFDEVVREQVILADPEGAYRSLVEHRRNASAPSADYLDLVGEKRRSNIGRIKMGLVQAIVTIVLAQKPYWPLSDRKIHYSLLNDPPLRNLNRGESSRYKNDLESYKDTCEILTRMRLEGMIPFASIADPTRTVECWDFLNREVGEFVKKELDGFLKRYWRNLQQSQPTHNEIVGEKNTTQGSIHGIAAEFCIPYTIGRGYSSLDPRKRMFDRFKASGKDRLTLLFLSDFDPEGEDIPNSFALSMRDDFGIRHVDLKKVCLTYDQVKERNLFSDFDPDLKQGSRKQKFHDKYGDDQAYFELEALDNQDQQDLLRDAINEVLDHDAFQKEQEAEAADAARLEGLRKAVLPFITKCLDNQDLGMA
jgi:hypothetical protein